MPVFRFFSVGFDFGGRADLDARPFGEFVRAERHACGKTTFTVERYEEFGRAVDDAGLSPEVGSAPDVAQDLHESLHLVETAHFGLQGREDVEARKLGTLLRELGRNVAPHPAHVFGLQAAVDVGRVARHVDEIAHAPGAAVDVRGDGGKRQGKAHAVEFFFYGHRLFAGEDSTGESRLRRPVPFLPFIAVRSSP